MNRRKAIRNIFLGTGAAAIAVSGYEWYGLTRKPDLADLNKFQDIVSEMAETLIPATNTPGAKDAKVGEFVIKMVAEHANKKVQNRFLYGLHDVENYANSQYKQSFVKCTVPQREEILLHFEQNDKPMKGILGKVQKKILGTSFIVTLKTYTVMGYATSQIGATKGFAYDFIPGPFMASVPLQPGQRSWATK